MASMVFASSPLSAQSLVKLRTNSNYPRSSCYVPLHSKPNSYVHLSCNISHIESSKSSFTKGDGFSKFSVLKFPRVASTLSPSLNIIKASMVDGGSMYRRFDACKLEKTVKPKDIPLSDYIGKVLLIVNIPQQGSDRSESEINPLNDKIEYFNNLRQKYYPKGFEILGFLYDKNELKKQEVHLHLDEKSVTKILCKAEFPIFGMVELNKEYGHMETKKDKDLWYFLRHTPTSDGEIIGKITEDFEAILVDRQGMLKHHYPWFEHKSQPKGNGGDPGPSAGQRLEGHYPWFDYESQPKGNGGDPGLSAGQRPEGHYPWFDYKSQPKGNDGDPDPSAGQRPEGHYPRFVYKSQPKGNGGDPDPIAGQRPEEHCPQFDYKSQPKGNGGDPGPSAGPRPDPRYPIEKAIDEYFEREMKQGGHQQS